MNLNGIKQEKKTGRNGQSGANWTKSICIHIQTGQKWAKKSKNGSKVGKNEPKLGFYLL